MTDTVALGDLPRLTAERTAQHYKVLVKEGVPKKLARNMANRYHLFLLEQAFNRVEANHMPLWDGGYD